MEESQSLLESRLADQQVRIQNIEGSLKDILGMLREIRSSHSAVDSPDRLQNSMIEVSSNEALEYGDEPGATATLHNSEKKHKRFRKLAPSRARLASTVLHHLQAHNKHEGREGTLEVAPNDVHSSLADRRPSPKTSVETPAAAAATRNKPNTSYRSQKGSGVGNDREMHEWEGGLLDNDGSRRVWGPSNLVGSDLAAPMLGSTRSSVAAPYIGGKLEVQPDGTQRRVDENTLYDKEGSTVAFPPIITAATKAFWAQLWLWLCSFGTLEAKHLTVVCLDLIYVIGTTVVSILSLTLFTAKVFDRAEISDADWRAEAAWALVFQIFFCFWLFSRPFIRVRRGRWVVLDTVPAITRYYIKSGWLWFDIIVTIPWGLPYYMGLFDAKAFSILSLVNLFRWARCFRLNASTHPLSPSKLGFKLFVTFCAIITGIHMLAVLFPIMDQLTSTDISYLDGLYYIVITMSGVGYGDITPKQPLGRGFAIFIVATGLGSISLFTATLTKYLNEKDDWDVEIAGKRKMLRKMLNHYEIPWRIQKEMMVRVPEVHQAQKNQLFLETMSVFPPAVTAKVKLYVIAKSLYFAVPIVQEGSMREALLDANGAPTTDMHSVRSDVTSNYLDFTKVSNSKPSTLPSNFKDRADIDTFIHKIEPTNFWRQLRWRVTSRHSETYVSPTFKTKEFPVALELAARMKPHFMGPSETVFQSGDVGREMFFIVSGTVELSAVVGDSEDQKVSRCLKAMQFFGEAALLEETVRCARAKCVTACELYSLHQRDVAELKVMYPWLAYRIQDEIDIAVRTARSSGIFAIANAAVTGVTGDVEQAANGVEMATDRGKGLPTASDIASHLKKHAPNWAGPRSKRIEDDVQSTTSTCQSMHSLNCYDPRRSMGSDYTKRSGEEMQRFAREMLDRVHGVEILVDIPLSAFYRDY